jgi:hypothetical protein
VPDLPAPDLPPTAADARATRNGWSAEERAYRISRGRAIRRIYYHCKKTMPDHARMMTGKAKALTLQVWIDCRNLDRLLTGGSGGEQFYTGNFPFFDGAAELNALWNLTYLETMEAYTGKGPRFVHMREGTGAAMSKLYLHQFRELLKDLWSPEDATVILADAIQERAKHGDYQFAKDLGDVVADYRRRPERFTRNTSGWIARGWLTLRLYECPPDGLEAFRRAGEAASLLGMQMVTERQFLTAWRNVRSRVFGNANPVFSQSAGAE